MTDRQDAPDDPDDLDATLLPEPGAAEPDYSTLAASIDDTLGGAVDPFSTFVPARGREGVAAHETIIEGERVTRPIRYDALVRGDQVGEFRIQRLLGRGSFGAVYLARDLTLDRLVAVKVVLPEGQRKTAGEGRSLARLKHPNIVGVYGEAYDKKSGCSLLWMQFVDGCNLATLIKELVEQDLDEDWNESDLLRLLNPRRQPSDKERRASASRGSVETVCRIGQRLAEALSHAHVSGVTHRDIKPANILMQRDGTPLLADFNLADNESDDRPQITGGTIAYMPPEQFAQCLGRGPSYDAARADIYSLGVVLWELACGSRPHEGVESTVGSSGGQRLLDYWELRQQEAPAASERLPVGLEMLLRRAIAVDPEKRYRSARAMASAMSGMRDLERARRRAPAVDRIRQFVRQHLFWIILIGGVLPHVAASLFQSWYNVIWIGTSDEAFKNAFMKAFIAYNAVVYPACVGWLAWNLYQFAKGYRRVVARDTFPRGWLRKLRRRLLRLPRQFMIASAVGWFPGVILFPWLLGQFGQPQHWFHYGISFAIAGLIATTYSYAIVLYVVVCHGYRACWRTAGALS